jgi:hypothetical protein
LIDTPEGPKAVEDIKRGDLVQTVDAGACEVLYTRHSTQWLDPSEGSGYPILISAGALGAGRPNRDLVVSPQHRILVGCKDQLAGIFADESFVPARRMSPGFTSPSGRMKS